MPFRKYVWWLMLSCLAGTLTACNIGTTPVPTQDVGAVQTQAMELVATQLAMQQTQTAMVVTPTPLPSFTPLATVTPGGLPTFRAITGTPFVFNTAATGNTPLAPLLPTQVGDPCHQAAFIQDITVPDGTKIKPGFNFDKVWRIQNTGTCEWDDGYVLKYVLGGSLDGKDVPIVKSSDFVKPGQMKDFGVTLTAPLIPNTYTDCWRMQDDGGFYFGTFLCATIEVVK
jgi:hypothetical protein